MLQQAFDSHDFLSIYQILGNTILFLSFTQVNNARKNQTDNRTVL